MEMQSFEFAIDKIEYYVGVKADGSKVSIKVLRNGTIEQQGITATGAPINSVRPLKQHRFDHYKGVLTEYIKDQCNLSQTPLRATADVTKQYRTAYEKKAFGQTITDLRNQAVDDTEGHTIDEIASMRATNVVMNRVLGSLQRELMNPKKAKATTTKGPKITLTDEQKKEQRKAANDAAKAARLAFMNNIKVGVGDNGKLTLTA